MSHAADVAAERTLPLTTQRQCALHGKHAVQAEVQTRLQRTGLCLLTWLLGRRSGFRCIRLLSRPCSSGLKWLGSGATLPLHVSNSYQQPAETAACSVLTPRQAAVGSRVLHATAWWDHFASAEEAESQQLEMHLRTLMLMVAMLAASKAFLRVHSSYRMQPRAQTSVAMPYAWPCKQVGQASSMSPTAQREHGQAAQLA